MAIGSKTSTSHEVLGRILVVDRNAEDLRRLREYLGSRGYDIVQADGCEAALEQAAAGSVDLLVLDLSDPGVDGMEFCERFHDHPETAAVPVLVVTDPTGTDVGAAALRVGADDFLTRPLEMAELLVRAKMLLRMKGLHEGLLARNVQLWQVNEQLEHLNLELAGRNRELEQGMEMARRLQEALLPQQYPRVKNISFNHVYAPADEVGGDYFQIEGMSEDRAAIFMSDVSGHGVQAALITNIVKAVFGYVYLEDKTPAQVLSDVNSRFRSVLGNLAPSIFATAFLVVVDGAGYKLSMASAGHPSPFLIRKRKTSCEPSMSTDEIGPALGFFSSPEYTTVESTLSPGDTVLGFTDGVYELTNERREMFGLKRLQALIAENARLIPRDLIQKILMETDAYRGARRRTDDVCMVAIEAH